MKKIILVIISIFFAFPALAAGNINVSYPGEPGPIFEANNMAPGDIVSKTVTIINSSSYDETVAITVDGSSPTSSLAPAIYMKITEVSSGSVKFEGFLDTFFDLSEYVLGVIPSSGSSDYTFSAQFMSGSLDNDLQSLSEGFNFNLGFIAVDRDTGDTGGILAGIAQFFGFGGEEGEDGSIAGITDEALQQDSSPLSQATSVAGVITCPWWAIISATLLITIVVYALYLEKREFRHCLPRHWWIVPPALGLIAWIAHYFLHQGYMTTWYCDNFGLIITLEVSIYYVLIKILLKEVENVEEHMCSMDK